MLSKAASRTSKFRQPLCWVETHRLLGQALILVDELDHSSARRAEAIEIFGAIIAAQDTFRLVPPPERGVVYQEFGRALLSGEPTVRELQGAELAFRAALDCRPRKSMPTAWAVSSFWLGQTLVRRGTIEKDDNAICEGIMALGESGSSGGLVALLSMDAALGRLEKLGPATPSTCTAKLMGAGMLSQNRKGALVLLLKQ